jgi:chlorobactene glucosyltransferase
MDLTWELALSFGLLAVAIWLIARAFRQRGIIEQVAPRRANSCVNAPKVAIIVPARDESVNIGPCLQSLLAQDYPADRLQILAVDDNSSDGTGAIIAAFARKDGRIVPLSAPPLPPGWKGKVHACRIGAKAAATDAGWLCFLDADMRAEPLLIASAIAAAEARGLDLLSLAPKQELKSFAERLILPCGLYLLAFSQDLARVQQPGSGDAVATGQFMLLRRGPYFEAGGHQAVRTEICEDVALARLLKRRGHRVLLQDGGALLSTRMYTGWATLWPGIAKNLTEMLGGPLPTIAMAAAAIALSWALILLPVIDLAGCAGGKSSACVAAIPAFLASAAAFGLHLAGAAHFRIPFWYGFLFPLGYSAGALIGFDSVRRRLTGKVSWKGRVYQ